MKPMGRSPGSRRGHQLADSRENGLDRFVMMLILALELVELARERRVGGQQFTHAHEGTHDLDVHCNARADS